MASRPLPHPDDGPGVSPPENPPARDDRPRRFTADERLRVWLKGVPAAGLNIAFWRFDIDGNLMCWTDYENADSVHAWEIDHIVPLDRGGTNHVDNLRPLHCSRNRTLSGILDEIIPPDPLGDRERR